MKKSILSISLTIALSGATQNVHAVSPEPPTLSEPISDKSVPINKPLKFVWLEPNNNAAAKTKKYRLLISTNRRFIGYDADKNTCNDSCMTKDVQSLSYSLPVTNPFLQKANAYFWQVQAINSDGISKFYANLRSVSVVAVTIPNVDVIAVNPLSAPAGSQFTFSTTLTTDLPDGYSVKVDVGNGFKVMTGAGVSFNYTTTLNTRGDEQTYEVGIFDKSGAAIDSLSDIYTVTEAIVKPVVTVPSLSSINVSPQSITQGDTLTFSATLTASLPAGYSVKVDYGNGLTKMTGANTSFSLAVAPNSLSASLYSIGVYDAKGTLQGDKQTGNFKVNAPAPVVVAPPVVIKTTGYSKIANDGSLLSDDAKLGTAPTDWACTKDNKTGLIWEVKTDDGGLRDKDWYYSWYEPDASKNGGFEGYKNNSYWKDTSICKGSECDTYAFTNAVNAQSLCGNNDWRMPSIDELKGLLTTTSAINQPLNDKLYIDANYFPNTNYSFWSSSPSAVNNGYAWVVYFGYGSSDHNNKNGYNFVRLVR